MSPQAEEIRVIERSQVSPPPGTTVAESILPLTFLDLFWLNAGVVERVFFYSLPHSTSYFVDSILPNLKSSLSVALQQFYPLAGKLRRSPDRDDGYELHYVDGDAVAFTVAEHGGGSGDDFDDLSGSHARDVKRVVPLIPQLPRPDGDGGKRLLALQVTVFPNRGVALGVTVHHAACDGSSSMQFMSWWTAACARTGGLAVATPPPPVLDRSLVKDPQDLYSLYYKGIGVGGEATETMAKKAAALDTAIGTFTLGAEHITRLKEMVSSRAKVRCSTIVVTFAFAWVCLVKARAIESDELSLLIFAAECREKLRAPLPASYFGNCISGCLVDLTAGELTGEDGVAAAARVIGKAIEELKKKGDPFDDAAHWPEKYKNLMSQQVLSVAGSPRFRVYDMDFGWGRPRKVEIPSIRYTGAMAAAESREEEGGVEIGFVLPKHEMEEFEKHFTGGLIKLLH
ncbi:phenolic glucoside malonyltransferase 1-like [Canna indica]|uniref:Phenolic glucoside malonyltransferase 1-like n=1 Tax=Canna indica TaxID=4628 RepID=A0AAQ3QB41_9LILI|nr:phenolic glucoside malonyltransferase 1-like [Canna indica]